MIGNACASSATATVDGTASAATFYVLSGITLDSSTNLYLADSSANKIRKISPSAFVTTLAGSGAATGLDGQGTSATFYSPMGVAVDTNGNVFVADLYNYKIRRVSPAGAVTTYAGSGSSGSTDGVGTSAGFKSLSGITIDTLGNLFVADKSLQTIRKITPSAVVTTLAGTPSTTGSTNGLGTSASFYNPTKVAVDTNGMIYVTDSGNNLIRTVTSSGGVALIGGSGSNAITDGEMTACAFSVPQGIAVNSLGVVYVTETSNVRLLTPSSSAPSTGPSNTSQIYSYPLH